MKTICDKPSKSRVRPQLLLHIAPPILAMMMMMVMVMLTMPTMMMTMMMVNVMMMMMMMMMMMLTEANVLVIPQAELHREDVREPDFAFSIVFVEKSFKINQILRFRRFPGSYREILTCQIDC